MDSKKFLMGQLIPRGDKPGSNVVRFASSSATLIEYTEGLRPNAKATPGSRHNGTNGFGRDALSDTGKLMYGP